MGMPIVLMVDGDEKGKRKLAEFLEIKRLLQNF